MNLNRALFIIIWIVLLLASSCDRVSKRYDTFADVMKVGDNYKSWLPPFIIEERYGFFNSVSNIDEMFDLDTNKIWGKCTVTNESIHKFEVFFPQDTKFKLVFENEKKYFKRINFDNFTIFVDVDNGPYWYYALDRTKMIVYFFSESREYYYGNL
jgi:hypothetical protein